MLNANIIKIQLYLDVPLFSCQSIRPLWVSFLVGFYLGFSILSCESAKIFSTKFKCVREKQKERHNFSSSESIQNPTDPKNLLFFLVPCYFSSKKLTTYGNYSRPLTYFITTLKKLF